MDWNEISHADGKNDEEMNCNVWWSLSFPCRAVFFCGFCAGYFSVIVTYLEDMNDIKHFIVHN